MTYHDTPPVALKEVTSDGILSFFEDDRASKEDREWFRETITSPEYISLNNPISKYNWNKFKSAFARKYFPAIAPVDRSMKKSIEERMSNLFNNMEDEE